MLCCCVIFADTKQDQLLALQPRLSPFMDIMLQVNDDFLGMVPEPSFLTGLLESAAGHAEQGLSEASWNQEVHGPLIQMAVNSSRHSRSLCKYAM